MPDHKSRSTLGGLLNRDARRRLKHEQSPSPDSVEGFLRKRVPIFQRRPPGPTLYDHHEHVFKPEEDGAINDLKHIITAHDNESLPELQVHLCSWDKVFSLMSEARAVQESKTNTHIGVSVGVDIASRYINLIPEEYGVGLVKEGLALVFEALQKREENAQKILEVFETVPETMLTINTAYSLLGPETDDESIKREFYDNLVKDLPVLIAILRGSEPWYKKVVQFLILRIPETLSIDDILARWKSQTSVLKERVERMNIRILGSIKAKMDDAEKKESQSQATQTSILTLLSTNSSLQKALMEELRKLPKVAAKNLLEIYQEQRFAAGTMTGFLDEAHEILRETRGIRQTQKRPQQRRRAAIVTPIQLLGIIEISNQAAWDDLEIVLRQARLFDPAIQGRAGWLTKTEEFRNWLRAERSGVLLVDGCLPEHEGLITPMSGLCATLISSLVESEHNVVFFFFAGQHCDMKSSSRDANGPKGLMKSFIAQLLLCSALAKPNLDFLTFKYLQDLDHYDCDALCDLFKELIRQLPPNMDVYCIIDGVFLYEQSLWMDDLEYVADIFDYIVKGQRRCTNQSASLKVLMTNPGRSIELVKRTRKQNSVWKHISLASGQAITGVPQFGV
ncbi:hypothetical protein HD806DRAFT_548787 [Xylariaceae sp. AK1471]|nr:hypothetical protein HD806DRAFT_548787 [Xylariaceae sp. AK1471]